MSDPTLELAALVGTAIAGKPDVDREALHDVAIAVNPRLRARRAGCVPPPDNPPTQQPRNEEPMMTISTHWQERIDAAQAQPTVEIYGKTYRRIRYGEESHATSTRNALTAAASSASFMCRAATWNAAHVAANTRSRVTADY